ncbi:cell envelope biogenesis protein AsmA [Sulfitobacter alexandrii]|uniref:Cell envelope biogenesis protein AsmA n=1 Tax=Sulfitobacter alexandrii TaxID=1917485 RepID=A0A1J0WIY7_9RHOB|nr:AsmA family protein [Sulfitobacter alexandrii]APE44295.1 cell envelope biogenesis protein AsmA [Sulfitobacter alexandrii]
MKWVIRIIGALMLIVVLVVVGLLMLPAERIAGIAADQLRKVTGRDVTITGDVSMTFWPVLGVSADRLEVGNADWAKEGAMLSTSNAAIGVDAMALLRGEIRITNIAAESPTIRLESRRDGRASWQFTDATGAAQIETGTAPERTARPVAIEKLNITDATLIYDAEGADLLTYSGVDLSLDWPEGSGPADLRAVLRPAGAPVTVAARIGAFSQFLAGEVQPVEATVTAPSGEVTLDGRAALNGAVAGRVAFDTSDTAAFLAALGQPGVALPRGLGQRLAVTTDLTLTPERRLSLRELVADLGGNTLRGAADIGLNGTPQVNAQLNAGALDLTGVTGGGAAEGADATAGAGGGGWSTAPIDASGLAAFNGEIALSADSIDLGALKLGASRTLLSNDRSRMVFEMREVAGYGGRLTGQFVMNNRSGLSVGGAVQAQGVQMNPLLTDLADLTRFSGQGDAEVSFLGVGQSVDAIMRSLSGKGAVKVGRGTIEGIDLDALLGSFDVKGGTTIFDSLGAKFTMDAGVLRNDDLLLLLPNFNATGAGQVNLGAQTLDYTVTPKALRVNGDRGLAVPVRISGPWADPSIRPDLKAAVDLNFAAEKAQIEDRVKQKLAEELDLDPQDGRSIEEAVKDKVEDRLKQRLLKILE